MPRKFAPVYGGFHVQWCVQDVQTLRPEWSEKRCRIEMQKIERAAKDRMCELGWEVLEDLLPPRRSTPMNRKERK